MAIIKTLHGRFLSWNDKTQKHDIFNEEFYAYERDSTGRSVCVFYEDPSFSVVMEAEGTTEEEAVINLLKLMKQHGRLKNGNGTV